MFTRDHSSRQVLCMLIATFALLIAARASAQHGEAATPETNKAAAAPADDAAQPAVALPDGVPPWRVSTDELELLLLPLRKSELEAEMNRWLGFLQEKTAELSDAKIERGKSADESHLTELRARIAELEQQRAALADRCHLVLRAFKAKGGAAEEHEAYLAAVGGLGLDVSDTSTALMGFRAWLVSDDGGKKWMWAILKALVILVAFWILARIVNAVVKRALMRVRGASVLLRSFLAGLSRNVVLVIGAIVAVGTLGVDIGPLVAAIGAAGLVIGFALQGTLSNFASGIMILLYRPYDVGHYIEAGGVAGTVEDMTLVSTTLVTPDNQTIILPNNSVWGGVIKNATGRPTRRLDLTFGISYSSDIDRARAVLEDIVKKNKLVLSDPKPVVEVHALADSSVNFVVRPWVKTSDYWSAYWAFHAEVKRRFDKEGIGIPFPQMDIHVHQTEDGKKLKS